MMERENPTPGPWAQGRLLLTAQTDRWTQRQREEADARERCMVYAKFTAADRGEGRQMVAVFSRPADAALAALLPIIVDALRHADLALSDCPGVTLEDRKAAAMLARAGWAQVEALRHG